MLIVRALYELKSSGASLREVLSETLDKEGIYYTSTATYKDVWINRQVLLDGKKYYSMVLVYVDDILCIHKDTLVVIDAMASIYIMKQGSMGPPDRYLGVNIKKVQTQDVNVMWATHNGDYCKAEIANLEKTLTDDRKSLSQYEDGRCPYPSSFYPDIDTSSKIDDNGFHEYQQHIRVLRWAIELGRINIMTEVN